LELDVTRGTQLETGDETDSGRVKLRSEKETVEDVEKDFH